MNLRNMESNLVPSIEIAEQKFGLFPYINNNTKKEALTLDSVVGKLRNFQFEAYRESKN